MVLRLGRQLPGTAGYNAPSVGSAGSGIYAGRAGPIKTIIPTVPTTQQIVTTVSKKTCQSSQSILNYVCNKSKASSFSTTFSGRIDGDNSRPRTMRDCLEAYEIQTVRTRILPSRITFTGWPFLMRSVPLHTPQEEYKYVPSYFVVTVVCLLVGMSLKYQNKQRFLQFSTTSVYLAIFVCTTRPSYLAH